MDMTEKPKVMPVTQEQADDLKTKIESIEREKALNQAQQKIQLMSPDKYKEIRGGINHLPKKLLKYILGVMLDEMEGHSQVLAMHHSALTDQKKIFDKHEAEMDRLKQEAEASGKYNLELGQRVSELEPQLSEYAKAIVETIFDKTTSDLA